MSEIEETKRCFWCRREFHRNELSNSGSCQDCSIERMLRWNELQRQAHDQYMKEYIEHLNRDWESKKLDRLFGEEEFPK